MWGGECSLVKQAWLASAVLLWLHAGSACSSMLLAARTVVFMQGRPDMLLHL